MYLILVKYFFITVVFFKYIYKSLQLQCFNNIHKTFFLLLFLSRFGLGVHKISFSLSVSLSSSPINCGDTCKSNKYYPD